MGLIIMSFVVVFVLQVCSDIQIKPVRYCIAWGALVGLLAAIVACSISLIAGLVVPQEFRESNTYTLTTLYQDTKTSSSFFLGSGSLGLYPVYYFYKERHEGGYVLDSVVANQWTIIVEEDRKDGYMVEENYVIRRDIWGSPLRWLFITERPFGRVRRTFYIPDGSIKRTFSL